jgi:hypothetical protein
MTFHGDPGDPVTGGQSWHYDPYEALFQAWKNFDGGLSVSVDAGVQWSLDTAAPGGTTLKPGNYRNAVRFPFQDASTAGLAFQGNSVGCNTLTGSFKVFALKFDSHDVPTTADVTWEQHCEGGVPAAYGEVLLNAVPHATLAAQLRAARSRHPATPR